MNALQTSTLTFGTTTKTLVQNCLHERLLAATSLHERNGPESPGAGSIPGSTVFDSRAGKDHLPTFPTRGARRNGSSTPRATGQP